MKKLEKKKLASKTFLRRGGKKSFYKNAIDEEDDSASNKSDKLA